MLVRSRRPCPLCGAFAPRGPLAAKKEYTKILCPRCGTFVIEATLPARPWAQLDAEDMQLVVFLPGYIRRRNRWNHTPLITLENWRACARRGRIMALHSRQPATNTLAR